MRNLVHALSLPLHLEVVGNIATRDSPELLDPAADMCPGRDLGR